MVTAMGSTSKISINIQKSKKLVSYSRLTNMPKTDINGRIYDVASIFVNCLRGKIFFLKNEAKAKIFCLIFNIIKFRRNYYEKRNYL